MVDPTPQNPNPDYQDRDIRLKPIAYFIIGLAVLTVVVVVTMAMLFNVYERRNAQGEADRGLSAGERALPPEPRLIVDEQMELEAYLEKARAVLDSYAVIDEDTVRIPIDVAMERVAEQGLPRWAPVVSQPEEDGVPSDQEVPPGPDAASDTQDGEESEEQL